MATRRPLAIATSPTLADEDQFEPLYNTSITVRDSHTPGDSSHSITAGDSSCSADDFSALRTQISRRTRVEGPQVVREVSVGAVGNSNLWILLHSLLPVNRVLESIYCRPPSLLITGDTNFSAGHLAPLTPEPGRSARLTGKLSAAISFASLRLVTPRMTRMMGLIGGRPQEDTIYRLGNMTGRILNAQTHFDIALGHKRGR